MQGHFPVCWRRNPVLAKIRQMTGARDFLPFVRRMATNSDEWRRIVALRKKCMGRRMATNGDEWRRMEISRGKCGSYGKCAPGLSRILEICLPLFFWPKNHVTIFFLLFECMKMKFSVLLFFIEIGAKLFFFSILSFQSYPVKFLRLCGLLDSFVFLKFIPVFFLVSFFFFFFLKIILNFCSFFFHEFF